MNKRYYKAELLIEDTFEDEELNGNEEMSTAEILEFITSDLPFGFKVIKKSVMKVENVE